MRKRLLIVGLLLILTVSIVGCEEEYMNLRGKVIDKSTNQPISNARIQAGNKVVKTNNKGYFTIKQIPVIDDLDAKKRRLQVNASGYKDHSQPIILEPGDKSVKVKLKRKYMELKGKVID